LCLYVTETVKQQARGFHSRFTCYNKLSGSVSQTAVNCGCYASRYIDRINLTKSVFLQLKSLYI